MNEPCEHGRLGECIECLLECKHGILSSLPCERCDAELTEIMDCAMSIPQSVIDALAEGVEHDL